MIEYLARQDRVAKVLLCLMLIVALLNAIRHDPHVGYDAADFISYIRSLSYGRLPRDYQTHEFFTPPLPFTIPATLLGLFNLPLTSVLKITQVLNVLLAFGSAVALMRICDLIAPRSPQTKNLALGFMLTLPVFYKSHAFIRAEPYVLFFVLLYVGQLLSIWKAETLRYRDFTVSGLSFGALILSRQWGLFILPGIALFALLVILEKQGSRSIIIKGLLLSGAVAFLTSSWFYFSLQDRYGSVAQFNREPVGIFSLRNQPLDFYFGSGDGRLFTDPVRDSFDNQLLPILYSDTWGDYWEYFVVYGEDLRSKKPIQGSYLVLAAKQEPQPSWLKTNRYEISAYLGRVNLVSLLPTGIALLGLVWGCITITQRGNSNPFHTPRLALILFIGVIASSLLGYLWFLISYPSPDGDTIKATYLLQIYPFISIVFGLMGGKYASRNRWVYPLGMVMLLAVFFHNIGAVITRYSF